MTKLTLKRIEQDRQPAPFTSQCLSEWPEELGDESVDLGSYQESLCQTICIDRMFSQECDCSIPFVGELVIDKRSGLFYTLLFVPKTTYVKSKLLFSTIVTIAISRIPRFSSA